MEAHRWPRVGVYTRSEIRGLRGTMDPGRWQKIDHLYHAALEQEMGLRAAFLQQACAGDESLQQEVESLLAQEGQSFPKAPVLEEAARALALDLTGNATFTQASSVPDKNVSRYGAAAGDPVPSSPLKERYLLQRQLGRGGFGVVYLAMDQQLLSKLVVVKIMLNAAPGPWERRKFRNEIEALARLSHPGVVSILDKGETPDNRPFLVMEYIEGVSLRSLIRPEGMDFERIADIARQAGSALDSAHRNGIWHRDLKPENIMIQTLDDGDQRIKLIDFGIATVQGSEVLLDSTTRVAGTFRYMAPEQLRGRPSAASDIYSLGVIVHEMLTGRMPFNAETAPDLYLLQKAGVEIRPSSLRSAISERVEWCVLKALQFGESDRPKSVAEFAQELVGALRIRRLPSRYEAAEAEPHFGRLVSKMCDRRAQEDDFKGFLARTVLPHSGRAAFCLIHGDEGECHESLIERLAYHTELLARKVQREERPPVKVIKIPWQYEGSVEVRLRRLVGWLFERFWAGRELQLVEPSPAALGDTLASSFSSFVFLQHDIRAARWDDLTKSLVQSYRGYLSEIPTDRAKPHVVVFLNVIYPPSSPSGWRHLLFNPKALSQKLIRKRIQRDLREIATASELAKNQASTPFLLLDELKPITRDDVLEWFSLHNILETEEQRIRATRKLFAGGGTAAAWKSMAEVETHLKEVQRSFLLERGFV